MLYFRIPCRISIKAGTIYNCLLVSSKSSNACNIEFNIVNPMIDCISFDCNNSRLNFGLITKNSFSESIRYFIIFFF